MILIILCGTMVTGLNVAAQSTEMERLPSSTYQGKTDPDADPGKDRLDMLVKEALVHNPDIAAQRSRVQAAGQRPSQAGALPDPTADVKLMMLPVNGGLNGTDALTKGVSIGVTQRLPYPGKLKLKTEKAQREVDTARAKLRVLESRLRGKVLSAAYRCALFVQLLAINEQTQDALKAAADGAAAIYATGKGSQADVLLAQTALTRSRSEKITLEKQLNIARARLDDLVGSPVPRDLIEGIHIPEPDDLPPFDVLVPGLKHSAPMVLKAQSEVAVRDKQVDIAKRNFKPDFFVGGRYRHNDVTMGGHDYFTAVVGMTLPFFNRKKRYMPALQEASLMRTSAIKQVDSALNEARFMLTDAYERGLQDLNIYSLYKSGLLIQAEKAYHSSLSSYTVGEADFMTLLRSLSNYYDYQSQALIAKVDYHVSVARMEAVLGRSLKEVTGSTVEQSVDQTKVEPSPAGTETAVKETK